MLRRAEKTTILVTLTVPPHPPAVSKELSEVLLAV